MIISNLPSGVRFGMLSEKPPSNAPTLFIFAQRIEANLAEDDFFEIGRLLQPEGFLCVSLDVPCHGEDQRPDEPKGLLGWRRRLDQNENFLLPFVHHCSAVLDYLIAEGYSDAEKISVCGNSRGGFAALHWAAHDERVRRCIGMAPVTRLRALREMDGLENQELMEQLSLIHQSEKLAGRSLWMNIGNNDTRVNTGYAIEFARGVIAANIEQGSTKIIDVECQIVASIGHTTPPNTHELAAAWLKART